MGGMKQLIALTSALFVSYVLALTAFGGPESLPSGKEMKEVAPIQPSCDYSWTGFYAGLNVGYGWGDADTHFDTLPQPDFIASRATTLYPNPDGVLGGGQIGFNWQWHRLVFGPEADFQGSAMDGTDVVSPIIRTNGTPQEPESAWSAHEHTDWFGTVRGRIGFTPLCRLLVYGTGGFAYGNVHYSANTDFGPPVGSVYPLGFNNIKTGWTAGGGLEYALTHHWSLKVEYLHYDLGSQQGTEFEHFRSGGVSPIFHVHYDWDTTANLVRGGVNFKF